jgi:hypothetical protein
VDIPGKIARLEAQIENAPQHRGDGRLTDWHTETATLLRLFLGEDNENYAILQPIRYTPTSGQPTGARTTGIFGEASQVRYPSSEPR